MPLSRSDWRALIVLASVALATGLPFVHRAYFIDDFYFVTMAKGITQHPSRPYDFRSDDAGRNTLAWERGQLPRMVNPPLLHYYLAGVIKLLGEESWKLRSAYLLFSVLSLFLMYFLGKRFVAHALFAALLMAVTPVYWLSSYSLLIDGPLLTFLLASLLTYALAQDKRSVPWAVVSGILMGLTMLVKYPGVLILPLAMVWQWSKPERRRWLPGYLPYVIFLLIQIGWAVWNIHTYGQSHLLAAMQRGMTSLNPILLAQKSIVVGSFIGGGILFVFAAAGMLWRVSRAWCGALVGLSAGLYALFHSAIGGFDAVQSGLLAVFVTGAVSFLVLSARLTAKSPTRERAFLLFWIFAGILELVIVMPWTAGRYLLCVLPAVCWMLTLHLESLTLESWKKPILVACAGMSLLIAHADYLQANTILKLSERFASRGAELQALAPKPAKQWYYLSDTFDGSQAYMAPLGWQSALPGQPYQVGDLLMRAVYRKSSWWNIDQELHHFRPVLQLDMRSKNPIRVMDVPASAGFYASCWGALPWTVSAHPLERYELYQSISE